MRSNAPASTRQPQQCLPAEAQAHPLTLTHARCELLTIVNAAINRRIASTTDEKLYGRVEYWTLPEVPLVSLLPAEAEGEEPAAASNPLR